jgi:hypothetical protein
MTNTTTNKLKPSQRHKKLMVEIAKENLPSMHYKLATATRPIDIEILKKLIQASNEIILEYS